MAAKALDSGLVVGIDVGLSKTRKTTCFTALRWDRSSVTIDFRLTTSEPSVRRNALLELVDRRTVDGVGIDGPLAPHSKRLTYYRSAEALLSRGLMQKRGKPGQTSAPIGQRLHEEASQIAEMVVRDAAVKDASHLDAVDKRRVVEAFPNSYLAALLEDGSFVPLNRDASDVFWTLLIGGKLERHMSRLLPGRKWGVNVSEITHHDHRAGLVCALTALSVTKGCHVAVGDKIGGDIMLPPREEWGAGTGAAPWLVDVLTENLPRVKTNKKAHLSHRDARVVELNRPWGDAGPRASVVA